MRRGALLVSPYRRNSQNTDSDVRYNVEMKTSFVTIHSFDATSKRDVYVRSLKERKISYHDLYDVQCAELAEIRDPRSFGKKPLPLASPPADRIVEYPWRNMAVRTVEPHAFSELRTARNRNLITPEEQSIFAASHIAFAGLNVGNPGAVCVALEGGARSMSLADPDILSTANLNRFRAGLPDVGLNKAELTARQILEIDPYYTLSTSIDGLTPDSLTQFLSEPKACVLVEEMDALPLKLFIRDEARKLGIPVVMVTGVGDGVLLDVERYDLDSDTPLLNGLLDCAVEDTIRSVSSAESISPEKKTKLAQDFIGTSYIESRLNDSFREIGSTLSGIPQIAEWSFMRGAVIGNAVRTIVCGGDMPSGRYSFSSFHA